MRSISFAVAMLVFVGCSSSTPKLYSVKGKVLVGDTPAAGALVVFHPKGQTGVNTLRPSAVVGEDGTFFLDSSPAGKGAPLGDYDVTVIWEPGSQTVQIKPTDPSVKPVIKGMGGSEGGESKITGDKLKGRYSSPTTSGLKATVEAKDNELPPFKLN